MSTGRCRITELPRGRVIWTRLRKSLNQMTQMIIIASLMVDHEAFDCVHVTVLLCSCIFVNHVSFYIIICNAIANGHARKGVGLVESARWLRIQDIASTILILIF